MIEKSFTDEEIAAIVRKHGLPRYPKIALLREKLSKMTCQRFHTVSRMRENCTYGSMRGRTYPAGASRPTLHPNGGVGVVG